MQNYYLSYQINTINTKTVNDTWNIQKHNILTKTTNKQLYTKTKYTKYTKTARQLPKTKKHAITTTINLNITHNKQVNKITKYKIQNTTNLQYT